MSIICQKEAAGVVAGSENTQQSDCNHKAIFYSKGYVIHPGEKLKLRGKINEQSICSNHLWLIEVIGYQPAERNEKIHLSVNFEL